MRFGEAPQRRPPFELRRRGEVRVGDAQRPHVDS
jgi:hypothetical protein